jgi:large subunit ribosomal protein L31e
MVVRMIIYMTEKKSERLEREYVIPLRKQTNKSPSYKKANKAIRTIKEFLARHMKVADRDLDLVKIDKYLNETIWHRGIKHPPAKIKVKAIKENGIVTVTAVEMSTNLKFKKLRAEKVENKSKEVAKKKKSEKVEENVDKDKDGVEDKKEEKEDKAATVEAEEKIEKAEAKEQKHTTKEKSPKEQKNMKVGYNRSSQGQ